MKTNLRVRSLIAWGLLAIALSACGTTSPRGFAPPAAPPISGFQTIPHLTPINQDTTSTCWSFATLSFIESEVLRIHGDTVHLAPMYPVYCIFLEKTKEFIRTKGQSRFAPGDLFTGVLRIVPSYGLIPESAYKGDARGCSTYNHDALYHELDAFTTRLKKEQRWDEVTALDSVRIILAKHLGAPPAEFEFRGKKHTPQSFVAEVVNLIWSDYVLVTSFEYAPYYTRTRLDVPDNWKNDASYLNLPLNEFVEAVNNSIARDFGVAADIDFSEPEYQSGTGIVFVRAADVPSDNITPAERELRFRNGSTTDDHLVHIVGSARLGDERWYLVKDSWRTMWDSATSTHPGYFRMHESYLRLKVLALLIHKDALPESALVAASSSHPE